MRDTTTPGSPSRRIRLALYSNAEQWGGAEAVAATIAADLPSDFEVCVVGTTQQVIDRIAGGRPSARRLLIPRRNEGLKGLRRLGEIADHRAAFGKLAPDVVHVNMGGSLACSTALAALSTLGIPYIMVEHLPGEISPRRNVALKRSLAKRASAHVAVGRASAQMIEGQLATPPGRVRVILNGVSVPGVERPRNTHPVLGVAGRLETHKGIDVLLEALCAVPDARLLIAGDGSQASQLRARARDLGLTQRVEFIGWVDQIEQLLERIDVFVLPSRWEALPLVLVEAMQAGVPLVATDVGSVADLVEHRTTGLLVPPEDPAALAEAVRWLLADPPRMHRIAAEAQEHARRHFSTDTMVGRYSSLYRSVTEAS